MLTDPLTGLPIEFIRMLAVEIDPYNENGSWWKFIKIPAQQERAAGGRRSPATQIRIQTNE
jgi:hypothetical protein